MGAFQWNSKSNLRKGSFWETMVSKHNGIYLFGYQVAFISELPKTISGKILRSKLRNQEWGRWGATKERWCDALKVLKGEGSRVGQPPPWSTIPSKNRHKRWSVSKWALWDDAGKGESIPDSELTTNAPSLTGEILSIHPLVIWRQFCCSCSWDRQITTALGYSWSHYASGNIKLDFLDEGLW